MRLGVFAIHDAAVKAFLQPFFMRSNAEANRAFEIACKDRNSNFHRYPEHFTLYRIGFYDDTTGVLEASEPKEYVCKAVDCVDVDDAPMLRGEDIKGENYDA